jgi:hypothetical protein
VYFFDFLVSVGGEKILQEDAKAKPREDGLSQYVFHLRKQYFDPGELLEDPLSIDLVFRQIVNSVASAHASCGLEGAITTLAAFYFVVNEGKIPNDLAKK